MKNPILSKQVFKMNLENELPKDDIHSNKQIQAQKKAQNEQLLKKKGLENFKNEVKILATKKETASADVKNETSKVVVAENIKTSAIDVIANNNTVSVIKPSKNLSPENTAPKFEIKIKNIINEVAETKKAPLTIHQEVEVDQLKAPVNKLHPNFEKNLADEPLLNLSPILENPAHFDKPNNPADKPLLPENLEIIKDDVEVTELPANKLPQFEQPIINPNLTMPEQPEFNLPTIETPKVEVPKFEVPSIDLPEIERPQVNIPKVEKPETESPNSVIPHIELPTQTLPIIKNPSTDVPKINSPKLDIPNAEPPKGQIPEVTLPKIELPKVEIPNATIPEKQNPEVNIPKMEAPQIELPNANSPKFEIPTSKLPITGEAKDLPKIELPKIDSATKAEPIIKEISKIEKIVEKIISQNSNVVETIVEKTTEKQPNAKLGSTAQVVKTIEVKVKEKPIKIDENDAIFFSQLVKGATMVAQGQEIAQLPMVKEGQTASQEPVKVSTALMNLIEDAYKSNKPLRIDFDKNLSVIIRMDSKGKISAEFLPGDKAMEEFLKKNIPLLQERFNQQDLEDHELYYKRRNQQNSKENQQNKEGKNE